MYLGQDEDEAAPVVTEAGAAYAPVVPQGYRMLPGGALVRLDALGAPHHMVRLGQAAAEIVPYDFSYPNPAAGPVNGG